MPGKQSVAPTACAGECPILGVRDHERIRVTERIAVVTRPGVIPGGGKHRRAYRVEFDIAIAGEQIGERLHQAGLEAPLPQGAAAPVFRIDVGNVLTADVLHHAAQGLMRLGRDEQVHMVGHQDIGMDLAAPAAGGLGEPPEIGPVVVVGEKDGLAVVTALDDVGGDAGKEEAGLARHWGGARGKGSTKSLAGSARDKKGSDPFSLFSLGVVVRPPGPPEWH